MSITDRLQEFRQGWDRLSLGALTYLCDGAQPWPQAPGVRRTAPWRLPVWVVARHHYFEHVQDYPVGNAQELRRILRHEPPPGPFRGPVVQRLTKRNEQSLRVTRWVMDSRALPALPSTPLLLIPESALLPPSPALRRYAHARGTLLHYEGPEGLRSTLLQPGDDEARVLEAMGAPPAASDAGEALMPALEQGLRTLPLSSLPGFWHFERPQQTPFPWARAGALSGALIGAYLGLTSLALLGHNGYLSWQLARQDSAIEAALATQGQLRAAEQQLAARAALLGSGAPGWTLWPLVVDLTAEGMQLNALRFEDGEVTLFGAAPRAIDLLERAAQHPAGEDARFIQPVRQGADGESFALRFRPRPLTEAAPDA